MCSRSQWSEWKTMALQQVLLCHSMRFERKLSRWDSDKDGIGSQRCNRGASGFLKRIGTDWQFNTIPLFRNYFKLPGSQPTKTVSQMGRISNRALDYPSNEKDDFVRPFVMGLYSWRVSFVIEIMLERLALANEGSAKLVANRLCKMTRISLLM